MEDSIEESENSPIGWMRQPIVSVLGHVDHGKTSILDHIRSLGKERQASVMDREAGGITQHIGATEVPAKILNDVCQEMLQGKSFNSPGLLFIDTPGHQSFSTLRDRGGNLADIAILVVDIFEGLQPQTIESLQILKHTKTPFVFAANKIDRIHGWNSKSGRSFMKSWHSQRKDVQAIFEEKYWKLVSQVAEHGFNLERYDDIRDFTQSIALVPCSAKEGEGIQDLLAITVGLAERFLSTQLTDTLGPAEASVLELRDERGLGKIVHAVLHRGELHVGDSITLATPNGPTTTHVKGMFRPKGMSEMRDAGDRWEACESAIAACGIKISAPELEQVLAGTTIRQSRNKQELDHARSQAKLEAKIAVELAEEGVIIKADTLGGLEALAFELAKIDTPIRMAGVGPINKKDFLNAEASKDPIHQVVIGFSVEPNSEMSSKIEQGQTHAHFINGEIIYGIIEEYEAWVEMTKKSIDEANRENLVYPGKLLYMENHTFRNRNPAIVGIRILSGRAHIGQRIMKTDGTPIGQIKSMRNGDSQETKEAMQGDEVAMAISGPTVGRQIDEGDVFYVDVPSSHAKRLRGIDLSVVEQEILDEITALHRKSDHFWGR